MPSIRGFLKKKWLESKLERPPLVVESQVPETGLSVSFVVHTWYEYHNRAQGSYTGEPDMVEWLKTELRTGDVLWDIGANVGAYSLLAAKLCPGARVIAFEPFIPNFAHLWENVVLNRVTSQVHPVNIGLSDKSGPTVLGVNDPRAGSSNHQVGGVPGKATQNLLAFSGDDAVAKLGLPAPTMLKLDIDGLEVEAVRGLENTLRLPTLRAVMIEVESGKSEAPVLKLCEAAGLRHVYNPLTHPTEGVFNTRFSR